MSTLTFEEVQRAILEADRRGEPAPQYDDMLVEHFARGYDATPELDAAIQRFAPARRAAFAEKVREALRAREAELPDSTPLAFASYLNDPAFEENRISNIVDNVAYALRRADFYGSGMAQSLSTMFESWLGGGAYTAHLLDRVLVELAKLDKFSTSHVGAEVRLMLRRIRFMALRGTTRPLALAKPDADVRWVVSACEGIAKEEPLAGLTTAEIDELCAAWSALDWDESLYVESVFGRRVAQPAIETRPWDELVALVEQTSLQRLGRGESQHASLTRLFGRPEPLDERIALAERIAAFAKQHPVAVGGDAIVRVLKALLPHVIADGRPLTGALEAAALAAFRRGEASIRDLLLALPRPQVDRWIAKLRAAKASKQQALAEAYAAQLAGRA